MPTILRRQQGTSAQPNRRRCVETEDGQVAKIPAWSCSNAKKIAPDRNDRVADEPATHLPTYLPIEDCITLAVSKVMTFGAPSTNG